MTEEDVIKEGRLAGIPFFDVYDWTWGEVQEFVLVNNERNRRKCQDLSVIAYHEASTICQMFNGEKVYVFEEFPYWNDEEKADIKRELVKIRNEQMIEYLMARSNQNGG